MRYAERWINMVRTLLIDARCPRPIRLHRSCCPSSACKTHLRTFIPPQGVALVCSECETTETCGWFTNRVDAGKPVCKVCYNRQVCHARRSHTSIFHHLCVVTTDPNTRGAPFHSSLPAMESAPVAVRMGEIQAHCLGRSSRTARGTAGRVANERCAIYASSLSFSLCPSETFVGMITSVTSCFVSTHVVRVPYSLQELAIETAAGTTCVECGTHTTKQWFDCKDESGNKFCVTCYHKNQLDVAAAAGTTCVKCGTDTTSRQWFNCKDKPGTKLCKPCYEKNLLDVAAAAGRTCVECGTDTTGMWFNCKDKPGTKFCVSCYQKNQLDVAAAAGTTCVKCGTDMTIKWINCKDKPGTKFCMSCYNKNRRKKKAAASPNEQ